MAKLAKKRIVAISLLTLGGCVVLFGNYAWERTRFLFSSPMETVQDAPEQTPPGQMVNSLAPNSLRIASLAIEAPVIYITEKTEPVYQDALQRGVVHYPGTAQPGQLGNVYIFGHSSDFLWSKGQYKTVFARLPDIQTGERIEVTDDAGTVYAYVVTETFVVNPDELWVTDQYNNEKALLTLQTSYPLGTALQRFIVRAELENK